MLAYIVGVIAGLCLGFASGIGYRLTKSRFWKCIAAILALLGVPVLILITPVPYNPFADQETMNLLAPGVLASIAVFFAVISWPKPK